MEPFGRVRKKLAGRVLGIQQEGMVSLLHSHAGIIFFEQVPELETLRAALPPAAVIEPQTLSPNVAAMLSGEGFLLRFGSAGDEITVEVDIVAAPWPDSPGDKPEEVPATVAYSVGGFGSGAFPGGLARALQQPYTAQELRQSGARHGAFVRIRVQGGPLSGASSGSPAARAARLLGTAAAIAGLPGAVAWYVPGAELLMTPERLREEVREAASAGRPPIYAQCSVRIYGAADGWRIMDTAGMKVCGLPDMEFISPDASTDWNATGNALLALCLYLMLHGDVIHTGHTGDGPKGRWHALRCGQSLTDPPREVIRWSYEGAPPPPPTLGAKCPVPPPPPVRQQQDATQEDGGMGYAEEWHRNAVTRKAAVSRYLNSSEYLLLTSLSTEAKDEEAIKRECARFRSASVIPGFGVIANTDNSLPLRPANIVGTFDARIEAIEHCAKVSMIMMMLYQEEKPDDADLSALQAIVNDDIYSCGRRVRIPVGLANGYEIYSFSALLPLEADEDLPMCLLAFPGPGPDPIVVLPRGVANGEARDFGLAVKVGVDPKLLNQAHQEAARAAANPAAKQGTKTVAKRWGFLRIVLMLFAGFFVLGVVQRLLGCKIEGNRGEFKEKAQEFKKRLEDKLKAWTR